MCSSVSWVFLQYGFIASLITPLATAHEVPAEAVKNDCR